MLPYKRSRGELVPRSDRISQITPCHVAKLWLCSCRKCTAKQQAPFLRSSQRKSGHHHWCLASVEYGVIRDGAVTFYLIFEYAFEYDVKYPYSCILLTFRNVNVSIGGRSSSGIPHTATIPFASWRYSESKLKFLSPIPSPPWVR